MQSLKSPACLSARSHFPTLTMANRNAYVFVRPRRYKTQLRDFLSTCRSKRKLQATPPAPESTPPTPPEVIAPSAVSAGPPPPAVTAYYYPEYPQYPQYPASAVDTSVFQYRYYPADYAPAAMTYTNGYGLERVMNSGYEVKSNHHHDDRLQYPPCQIDGSVYIFCKWVFFTNRKCRNWKLEYFLSRWTNFNYLSD